MAEMLMFEGRRLLRNFPMVFFGLAFPVILLLLFGGIYGNAPRAIFDHHGTVDVSVPAYFCLVIAVTGVMGVPLSLAEYRERKILKRLRATPVAPARLLGAQMAVNVILTCVGLAALVITGVAVFGLRMPAHPFLVLGAVALTIFAVYGMGLLIAAVASTERGAIVFANIVYFPMIFLSGATIPLQTMPNTLRDVARAIPLSYGVGAIKAAWLPSQGYPAAATAVLLLFGGACLALSVRIFRWE